VATDVVRTGNEIRIDNTGVVEFNGIVGGATLTGDSGAVQGKGNNRITVRIASDALTGVASFDPSHFTVGTSGHVRSKGVITINNQAPDANGNFEVASSTTTVNGVTGIGFGNDIGLTGKINLTAGSGISISQSSRTITFSNTGITGVRAKSNSAPDDFIHTGLLVITGGNAVSVLSTNTNQISIDLKSGYQVTGDTVVAGYGIDVVSSNNQKTINNRGVTSFNGLTGNVTLTGDGQAIQGKGNNTITARIATTALTGVASFDPSHFTVGSTGHVRSKGVITINGSSPDVDGNFTVASATVVTGDGGAIQGKSDAYITARIATTALTGVASFDPIFFGIGASGHVLLASGYQVTGDTVVAGYGINIVSSNNQKTINNRGVTSFNGLTGNVTLTGDGQAIQGKGNNTITVREATNSLTGVASFNSNHFSVVSGAVSLASGVTGDTVVAGYGIDVVADGKTKTINNRGVTSFNGLTGNVTLTGDSGAVQGKGNNRITVRIASDALTGVASFDPRFFGIGASGHVLLASAYQVTGDTVVAGDNITITRDGNSVTVNSNSASSTTIVNGVTGIGFGNDIGLTGKINLTAGSGISISQSSNTITFRGITSFYGLTGPTSGNFPKGISGAGQTGDRLLIATGPPADPFRNYIRFGNAWFQTGVVGTQSNNVRIASDALTGVASFDPRFFGIGASGHVLLASEYQVTGDTVVAGYGINIVSSNNQKTINNRGVTSFNGLTGNVTLTGDGQAIQGKGNNTITVREASTSVTGVASFNSSHFSVSNGAVSLKSEYQVTGDTVVAGYGINIVASNNQKTINNRGVTSFNGLTGNVTLTGDGQAVQGKLNNTITVREASTSVTGVASFNSNHFSVSNGAVSLKSEYQVTGDTVVAGYGIDVVASNNQKTINNRGVTSFNGLTGNVTLTGDSGAVQGKGNNRITVRIASDALTGVASFDPSHFAVGSTGHVRSKGVITINNQAPDANGDFTVASATVVTGDGGAIQGKSDAYITARIASGTLTGVASFDPIFFGIGASGHVLLASGYQVTGDTVVAGYGINIVASNNQKTINNTGVTSFNGLTGNVTLTGDSGAVQGKGNSRITVRQATNSLTGVASFNSSYFSVSNGAVSLSGPFQTPVFANSTSGSIESLSVHSGKAFISTPIRTNLIKHSQDYVSGVWNVYSSAVASSLGNTTNGWPNGSTGGIQIAFSAVPNANNGIYQVIPDVENNQDYTVSCWARSDTGEGKARFSYYDGSTSYFSSDFLLSTTPQRVSFTFRTKSSDVGSNVAFGNGSGNSVGTVYAWGFQLEKGSVATSPIHNDTGLSKSSVAEIIAIGDTARIASGTLTGVASFDPIFFGIGASGHVLLASGYQVTGDTVVAGYGINIVASNNQKTINNRGVTSFNGLTGNVTLTGDSGAVQGKGNNTITARIASGTLTGVASFDPIFFGIGASGHVLLASGYQVTGDTVVAGYGINIVASNNQKTINNTGVTSFNGLTGSVTLTGDGGVIIGKGNNTITARIASGTLTGVASFDPSHFTVGTSGHVRSKGVITINNQAPDANGNFTVASATVVTGDGGAIQGKSDAYITARVATESVTGVASFNNNYFTVSAGGSVSIIDPKISFVDSAGLSTDIYTLGIGGNYRSIKLNGIDGVSVKLVEGTPNPINEYTFRNTGVTSFNGLTGNVTLTGDGQAIQGKLNNTITVREASTSVTGVASFNSSHFSVLNGAVSLKSGVTGDTVVAGYGIDVVASNNQKTINNRGVTSFNGLTGNVTLTGDGQAIQGKLNNTITARIASHTLTGVASFDPSHFAVGTSGHVRSKGVITINNQAPDANGDFTVASSTTTVNGVTGIGFGNDIGLTGKINLTAGSNSGISITGGINDIGGTNVRQVTITNTGITGIRFLTVFDGNDSYKTGAITITGSQYISVSSNDGTTIAIVNQGVSTLNGLVGARTLTGDSGAVQGRGNTRITVREATDSLTGVASFNSNHFSVLNGAVSLKSGVTGDTVVAGYGIDVVASNNQKTINNKGVTSFNGLTGNVTLTGDGQAIQGKLNNTITARVPNDCGITGVVGIKCSSGLGINSDGLIYLDSGSPCISCFGLDESLCLGPDCEWCGTENQCICLGQSCDDIIVGPGLFRATNSGMGASANSDGSLAYLYLDVNNLATMGSTIESTDSVLFFDASEPGLIKTKKANVSKLILDNDNLFESKTPSQLTRNTKSSTIEFSVVLGSIAPNQQGLVKGASAHEYIAQNTVRSLNGMTGDLEFMINGCTGSGSGKITITGTQNEVNVSTSCPTIVIGLPDNVMIPYISVSGATFTETVSASLFIGSIVGGTF
jgi:S-ribosylhomocysteine lyase LuxS involved in autoinducer biosynthesis